MHTVTLMLRKIYTTTSQLGQVTKQENKVVEFNSL